MKSVKIFGAGSIGNHLAHAFKVKGFKVILSDIDPDALKRTKEDIYVTRYGKWDEEIELKLSKDVLDIETDIVFIGTPPDSHIPLALEVLKRTTPSLLLIEKPLSAPDYTLVYELLKVANEKNVEICVGYNHVVSKASLYLNQFLTSTFLGDIKTISSYTREHWGGIFKAHPWLAGPQDSYLGYYLRGGGALCEHSHGLNMWQHIADYSGAGKIIEVNANADFFKDDKLFFDKLVIAKLKTENGVMGDVIQDVLTFPAIKSARIQGEKGYAELILSTNNSDIVRYGKLDGISEEVVFQKKRTDDFEWEVDHLSQIIDGQIENKFISIKKGLATMVVISSILESAEKGKSVTIKWDTNIF